MAHLALLRFWKTNIIKGIEVMNLVFISMMMILIGPSLGETTLGSICRHTLHNYNVEFGLELFYLFKFMKHHHWFFCCFILFFAATTY
jgi:hypothetical protein